MRRPALVLSAVLFLAAAAWCPPVPGLEDRLLALALDHDPVVAGPARAQLRAEGPSTFAEILARCSSGTRPASDWDEALDMIAQQRGSRHCGLYWYTDLAAAERAAAQSGKPILALHLLGRLTDERSCANSRFFRSILYTNRAVADYLRGNVVLYWHSERPVPQVTIDFGDGRRIETTIAGNCVHYLLDAEGRPLDALPGLYGPSEFLTQLRTDCAMHHQWRAADRDHRPALLTAFHQEQLEAMRVALFSVGGAPETEIPSMVAWAVAPIAASESLAVSKCGVEAPVLKAVRLWREPAAVDGMTGWVSMLADMHPEFGRLDAASTSLIRSRLADGRDADNDLANLALSLARDTVQDEYILHTLIHRQFVDGGAKDLQTLDRWVYDRLFLTPESDPWLGLLPPGYDGLDHNGIVVVGAKR
ncbi:MAG: hypothetical protein H0W83_04475 [Planctomycetes bacterium]|nr:hypothetical protein [Planctomycetota bacterium]